MAPRNQGRGYNGKKRKNPPPRGRKQPVKKGMAINSEYHNIIIIFLGMFVAYGLASSSGAIVPKVIQLIFKGMFGGLAILVPIILITVGILGFVDGNEKIDKIRKTKMMYVIILFIIVYYGLINYGQSPSSNPFKLDEMQDIIKMGVTREGIGLIPSIITYFYTHVLGLVGAWLLTLFLTFIAVMHIFNISINDMKEAIKNKDINKSSIPSKLKFWKKKYNNTSEVDDKTTMLSKTSFFSKIRDKFSNEKQESVDDIDQTIKIVGFNKAEDDYLEILEGTQSLSDLEILQKMQEEGKVNSHPFVTGMVDNNSLSNQDRNKLLQLGDTQDLLVGEGTSQVGSGIIEDMKRQPVPFMKTMDSDDTLVIDKETGEDQNEHMKYMNYKMPPISLLNSITNKSDKNSKRKVLDNAKQLEQTLRDFGVDASINQVTVGPTITRYEIQPRPGVKVSKIVNLTDDIALSLAAKSIRMEAPIPGKNAIGIEVPNDESQMVSIKEVMESNEFNNYPSKLAMGLGKDVAGRIIIGDIAKMPHLLIAGSTGSGKSVCVNTLITSIIYKAKPDEVKLILIDPKVVELSNYNGIPHLMIPVVTDPKKAANALTWAVTEMNRRYKLFAEAQVKDINSYNEKTGDALARIVIIIDELADLMMVSANDVEDCIHRLAQMARAAGMHLIVATQRPSVDVITGVIKANIPSRIAFAVSSQTDSRTIIDMGGAEKLLGKGDMLFYPLGAAKPMRVQGAFISEAESDRIIDYLKKEVGDISYSDEVEESISNINTIKDDDADEFLYDAIRFVVENEQASASMLQRKYKIGFNRAARLIDDMYERGIIGASEGSKPRKVLISKEDLAKMED